MRIQDFLIGLVIATVCLSIILGYAFFSFNELNVNMDDNTREILQEFNSTSSQATSELTNQADDIRSISPGGESISDAGEDATYEDNILKSGWKAIGLIPQSYTTFNKILNVIEKNLPVPVIFNGLALLVIIIVVSLILLSSILRNRL